MIRRPLAWRTIRHIAFSLLLVFLSAELAGCVNTDRSLITGRKRAYGYTWAEEVQMGTEADAAIQAQYGLYDDPELASYVDRIGQEVLKFSEARTPDAPQEVRQTPFTFRVLDSPVVNAFALPGGYVYLTRGLMAHLENEAQLAVILGHEIGHVVGRHASIRAANQQLGQALLLGGAIGGQVLLGGDAASNILQGGSTVAQLAFLSYGRDDERESDRLGVEYAIQAGYDAAESAEFFNSLTRLSAQANSQIPSFLSTHPDPGERQETIHRLAAEWRQTHPVGKVGRDVYLARISGVVAGEDPRGGYTYQGSFYHPELAFQFPVPQNYSLINQASQVLMVASDEASVMRFYIESKASSAREAAEQFSAQQGLQVIESGLGSAYGLPAQYVVVDAADQSGNVIRARAHFVDYQNRVYAFLGMAARDNYSARAQGFVNTMQGFAPLTDPTRLNVTPMRIHLRTVSSPTPLNSLIPAGGVGLFSPNDIAILNQMELRETVAAGSRVKLVQ